MPNLGLHRDNGNKLDNNENYNRNSYQIIIDISDDYYEAYITVKMNNKDILITEKDIYKALEEKKIAYGIDHDIIQSIIQNPSLANKKIIAKGKRHKNGLDGKIIFNIDTNHFLRPQLLPDGRVDHKNLNFVNRVSKGDILAKKVNPIQGEDGITVTGKIIKAKPGRDIDFKIGKNVTVSSDGMLLISNINGIVKFIDGKVSVIEMLEIDGDVGVSTGNIIFSGKVVVKGNVQPGYTIKSDDDIEIYGVVEGAEIISKENIIVHKGIHNNSTLYAEKDVKSNYIENSKIEAKGNILCDYIMHSNIICNGEIYAHEKKGFIVGGFVKARKAVIAKTIGSNIGTITKIEVGIDQELLKEYECIKDKIKLIEENINKLNEIINILEKQIKSQNNISTKTKYTLQKALASRDKYIDEINDLHNKLKYLHSVFQDLKDSKVQAKKIFSGVKLKINDCYYNTKDILNNVTLFSEDGQIKISYY